VWNTGGFNALASGNLPILGLFERDHMEYEVDRATDLGGEPSLTEMTVKSIQLLEQASRLGGQGYFLMVEGGRIDHAHHEGNAYRALTDTQEFDQAIGTAAQMVDLRETLIIVSADHSHVFNIAGYPLRPLDELPYQGRSYVPGFGNTAAHGHGILDLAYDIKQSTGHVSEIRDRNGAPYTVLGYLNGPGYRATPRTDPRTDPFPGRGGQIPNGPWDGAHLQEAAVPLSSETHGGEDVAIYAIGPGAELVRGTVKNTHIFRVMKEALGL
jgi:alkaline phosphatase